MRRRAVHGRRFSDSGNGSAIRKGATAPRRPRERRRAPAGRCRSTRSAGKLEGTVPTSTHALAVHGEAAGRQRQQRRLRFAEAAQEAHNANTLFIRSRIWPGVSAWVQPTQNSVSPWQASVTWRCGPRASICSSGPACSSIAQLAKSFQVLPRPRGHALRVLQPARDLGSLLARLHRQHELDAFDLRQAAPAANALRRGRAFGRQPAARLVQRLGRFQQQGIVGLENGARPARFRRAAFQSCRPSRTGSSGRPVRRAGRRLRHRPSSPP